MKPLVIYHGGCRDGFCAAWVCNLYLTQKGATPEFFAGYYGQDPPDCTGRDVMIVDFSYPLDKVRTIAGQAATLLMLDHHKTAQADLEEFARNAPSNTRVLFDLKQSGAGLAYTNFFGTEDETGERPYLVDYVEDRDLWRHALPDSKIINAYIGTLPFVFGAWTNAFTTSQQDIIEVGDRLAWARQQGRSVLAKVAQYVAEVKKQVIRATFDGHNVPVVNAAYPDISEVLHALCEGELFAVGWSQRADGLFQYSLRSVGDFDVSEVARRYGGGGHKNAAGFESHELLHM